jgi:hypothetical protein
VVGWTDALPHRDYCEFALGKRFPMKTTLTTAAILAALSLLIAAGCS